MPPLLTRQHSRTFRRTVAIPAAAGLLALAAGLVTACTGSPVPPKPAATASGVAAAAVRVTGAGSTFDAPFFNLAFPAYQRSRPGVTVSYAPVGSSAGITRFTAGQADFGATDVPASAADLAGARGGPAVQVPVDLGAVSVAYNVLTRNGQPLKLTGPVLAEIFLGQITRWDDPAITALNPGADLPGVSITVVHRSDGSGTTYIFSDYLTKVSPAWANAVGTGRSLKWPAGYDAAAKPAVTAADFSIVNQPGPDAYPICGYSWVLISARQPSTQAGQALTALVSWLTRDGQAYAATLGYVPLPAAIQQLAAAALARVTGPDGSPLSG